MLIDPGATPRYRGIVVWRGLIPESDLRVDPLGGCDGVRPLYAGGHGLMYYVPGSGQSTYPATAFSRGAATSRFRRARCPRC